LSRLAVRERNWVYRFDYQAVEPFDMEALLQEFRIDYPATVFIDLGAGKGRVLMLAAKLPFKQIIGVEISVELIGIAAGNLRKFCACEEQTPPVELVRVDAASYRFPTDPLVVFLYNPFTVPVMQQVIENLAGSCCRVTRRVIVVYFRPELAEMWDYAPGFSLVKSAARFRIYDNKNAIAVSTEPNSSTRWG
jgi:predicted RNA methylase